MFYSEEEYCLKHHRESKNLQKAHITALGRGQALVHSVTSEKDHW